MAAHAALHSLINAGLGDEDGGAADSGILRGMQVGSRHEGSCIEDLHHLA